MMRVPVVCGIDIGTTNAKVVAIREDGSVVARVRRLTPRDADGLLIDARELLELIEDMVAQACGDRHEIHAVCGAGIGEDGVLVDAQLQPLTAALAWFDPRRQGIFRSLRHLLNDDESFDVESDPVRTIAGWSWSRAQIEPGEASSWIALADLASVCWTGRPFISDTLASRTAAWRSGDREWALGRVELTLGSPDLRPRTVASGDVVGDLSSPRLRSRGVVAADAIAVAGGHDHPVGGWGIRQLVPGAVVDSMGTAEVVVAHSTSANSRKNHVEIAPGILAEGRTLLRVVELARNIAWASQDPRVADRIGALLAGTVEPVSVLDSGFFIPGRRGGGRPSYSAAAPADPLTRASAVLGALAYAGREAIEAVRAGAVESGGVRMAGGWARSSGWLEIKSQVNGAAVLPVPEPEVTAVGAALLAARARGWQPDPARALSGATASVPT